MRFPWLSAAVVLIPLLARGLDVDSLSPEARKLFPEGRQGVVEPKTGEPVRGLVVSEKQDSVTLRIKVSETISTSRTYMKADINSFKYLDVEPQFAALLLDMNTDPKSSLAIGEYERALRMFDEFIVKCPASRDLQAVEERRKVFAAELEKLKKGWEKIGGEWLTPIRAAVKKFDMYSEGIAEAGRRPDLKTNPEAKAEMEDLVVKRRAVARGLPGSMQERIPELVNRKEFDEAAGEMSAFLGFWIRQVARSEGAPDAVVGEMNFDYIMAMQSRIMDAYRAAGLGAGRQGPKEQGMVYVPGGYFLMGDRDARPSDSAFPMRIVFVGPFLIDRFEVSNAEYRKFVEHVNRTGDSSMEHPDAPPLKKHDAEGWKNPELGGDSQPVVGVDWFDAYAYAKWAGKSLPTEAQWEKAARGMDGRTFPWGEEPADRCAVNWEGGRSFLGAEIDRQKPPLPPPPPPRFGCGCVDKDEPPPPPPPPTRIPPVTFDVDKSLPAMAIAMKEREMFEWNREYTSPCGTLHMAGNAAEWVADWYGEKYYGDAPLRDPEGPEKTDAHVYRGGSYLSGGADALKTWARAAGRGREASGCDGSGRPFIGFRCVKNIMR